MGGIVMWIARDKDGTLWLYENKPDRKDELEWIISDTGFIVMLSESLFPEVQWSDNEPRELILK